MHRFFALLASVLLVGAMAPAVAAAPPVYQVMGVTAISAGQDSPGCLVDVTVTFRAPAGSDAVIQFTQAVDEDMLGDSTPAQNLANANAITVGNAEGKALGTLNRHVITQTFAEVGLNVTGSHWHWGAQLFEEWVSWEVGVVGPLSNRELTGVFIGTGSCPAQETILATN